jgi:hypothetical protein
MNSKMSKEKFEFEQNMQKLKLFHEKELEVFKQNSTGEYQKMINNLKKDWDELTQQKKEWLQKALVIAQESCGGCFTNTKVLNYDSFLWAYCAISSRAFPNTTASASSSEIRKELVMWPILDLMNHNHDCKMEWVVDDQGVRFFLKEGKIEQGAIVWNNYGPKGNEVSSWVYEQFQVLLTLCFLPEPPE